MSMSSNVKYENVIIYLCSKLGGHVNGVKKLFKLLYYIDFDRFEYKESMKTITGTKYYAWKMGPVPDKETFKRVIDSLVKSGRLNETEEEIRGGYEPMKVYASVGEPDESVFSKDEKFILDRVISVYGNLSGKQLEALTHQEAPWIGTEQSNIIPFELAFYRGTNFDEFVPK